jgi:hypothetical protein
VSLLDAPPAVIPNASEQVNVHTVNFLTPDDFNTAQATCARLVAGVQEQNNCIYDQAGASARACAHKPR